MKNTIAIMDWLKEVDAGHLAINGQSREGYIQQAREWITEGWGVDCFGAGGEDLPPVVIAAALLNEADDPRVDHPDKDLFRDLALEILKRLYGRPFNVDSADVDAIGRACQQAEIVETHYPDSVGFVTPHEFQFNFEHRDDLEELRNAVNRIRKAFERDDCNSEA